VLTIGSIVAVVVATVQLIEPSAWRLLPPAVWLVLPTRRSKRSLTAAAGGQLVPTLAGHV
jgi:hypothetical protein